MKYESWVINDRGDIAVCVYDLKLARKLNTYLGTVYETLAEGDEPVFQIPVSKIEIITRLYLKQGVETCYE